MYQTGDIRHRRTDDPEHADRTAAERNGQDEGSELLAIATACSSGPEMTGRALRPPAAPLLEIPAAQEILCLDARARGALRLVLLDLRLGSRVDGDRAWRKRKGPMATYRHDIARHAGLLARALRRAGEGGAAPRPDRALADSDAHKPRSSRAAVRNPIVRLASIATLQRLPAPTREKLRILLRDLARACGALADQCWSRRERSDALYWRTAAVYAGHIRRAIQPHRDTPHQLSLLKDAA